MTTASRLALSSTKHRDFCTARPSASLANATTAGRAWREKEDAVSSLGEARGRCFGQFFGAAVRSASTCQDQTGENGDGEKKGEETGKERREGEKGEKEGGGEREVRGRRKKKAR